MAEEPKCQCPYCRVLTGWDSWIRCDENEPDPQPHEPKQCPGTYRLAQYERNGEWLWLCSWCC